MEHIKPIKVTLDIFGVSVEATFIKNENGYEALIPKTKAVRCYHAIIKQLVEKELPKDTAINISVDSRHYNTYMATATRFWEDDNNKEHSFSVTIYAHYQYGTIFAQHNLSDWLELRKKNVCC
jgi:hypothetical protein